MPAVSTVDVPKEDMSLLEKIRANTPDIVKDNAPRVVAALKITGCSAMMLSEDKSFRAAGAGFIAAFGTMAVFGGKKTEEEKALLR